MARRFVGGRRVRFAKASDARGERGRRRVPSTALGAAVVGAMEIGEAFEGAGAEAAHVNTVLGLREGPVGTAWATALATPSRGPHAPSFACSEPGLPTKPLTLFVNKAAIAGDGHASLTWGAAQAGVAGGVADAVAAGAISAEAADALVLIAAVWVDARGGRRRRGLPQQPRRDAARPRGRAARRAAPRRRARGARTLPRTRSSASRAGAAQSPGGRSR